MTANNKEKREKKRPWIVSFYVFAVLAVTFLTLAISIYFLKPKPEPAQEKIKIDTPLIPSELVE
ncbi:MAG: hypothetical protein KKC21_06010 [Nitrospinae bacterium]|nr:hypothetical protein [Nitrospinota bacterium]